MLNTLNDWETLYKYLSHLNGISMNSTYIDAKLYRLHHLEEIKDKIVNHLTGISKSTLSRAING